MSNSVINALLKRMNHLELRVATLEAELASQGKKEVGTISNGIALPDTPPEAVPNYTRRALLCGLNYPGSVNELKGCANDVELMANILISKFNYPNSQVQVKIDVDLIGSKDVLDYLKEQAAQCKWGQTIYFHYSGHGTQIRDDHGDEKDGSDEAITTHKGSVRDDQIAEVLQLFPVGTRVIGIFDCCNSGSIADMPYRYQGGNLSTLSDSDKKFMAEILILSSAQDVQVAADAWISERNRYYGALTANIAQIIDQKDITKMTWKQLTNILQTNLKEQGFTQIPQLSSNKISLLNAKVSF